MNGMSIEQLQDELERVTRALADAEAAARWGDVAALRVAKEHWDAALRKAQEDENRLKAIALSRKAEAEREKATAESEALQARLDMWNAHCEAVEKEALELWREYDALVRDETRVIDLCRKLKAENRYRGFLCAAAVRARDGRGPLRWRVTRV